MKKLVFACVIVMGGLTTTGAAFAQIEVSQEGAGGGSCASAASNVNGNGGHCTSDNTIYQGGYSCQGNNGVWFDLAPGTGPTGCDIRGVDNGGW
jgi:hypothetical protein